MRFVILIGALIILAGCSHAGHSGGEASSAGENEKGAMDDPGFLPRLFGQEPASADSGQADGEIDEETAPAEGEPQED